jgi:hypothetical protein
MWIEGDLSSEIERDLVVSRIDPALRSFPRENLLTCYQSRPVAAECHVQETVYEATIPRSRHRGCSSRRLQPYLNMALTLAWMIGLDVVPVTVRGMPRFVFAGAAAVALG